MRFLPVVLLLLLFAVPTTVLAEKPALVVIISVDQLRGDMPFMYRDRFVEGGFNRFLEHGTIYPNAHFGHTTTYTASGHATLATGGNPREHGLVGNAWVDPATGESIYCVQDTDHTLLDASTRTSSGTSPKNMITDAIGDALIDATNGASRVFSVSRKDRSAILMGGHKGKAFWYDTSTGRYITSTYYYDAYPKWAAKWNKAKHVDAYLGATWDLLRDRATYVYRDEDERDAEMTNPQIGETFPHSLKGLADSAVYSVLNVMPFSDELTLAFAKETVVKEKLGLGSATDMFALSLSATDGVGHAFGPYSLEAEDNVLRVDALLADFFAFLDKQIGLDKVLLVLSADHGVDGNPKGQHMGQVDPIVMVETARKALRKRFGVDVDFVHRFVTPYIYFKPEVRDLDAGMIAEMEDIVAEALRGLDGVVHAIPRHKILADNLDDSPLMQNVRRSFHPERSGNIFMIQDEYYRFYSTPRFTATHGAPYEYDTHVPVMFAGQGIPAQSIDRAVGPESIAATIAALLDIPAPSGATGPVLTEVVSK